MAHAATPTIRRTGSEADEFSAEVPARRASQRRQMLLLAAASYGIDAILLTLYHFAGITFVFLFTDKPIGMPMNGYFERAITMLALVATIARFSFVGLYGSMMRETLYKRGKELKQAYARIEELARFDELTGALNRRSIMSALDEEIARASRSAVPCSVALIDLDHFKRINDQFGHPTGDEALRTFAITVFANIRSIDKLGRYGGEEFLLVLPETTPDEARRMLDRLRAIMSELDWATICAGMTVTMSAGVTSVREGEAADVVLARADAALYRAKGAGRDCILTG
jgi:diguanylate cyclase (GGDEF)-like protein